jgi:hypothetical protein
MTASMAMGETIQSPWMQSPLIAPAIVLDTGKSGGYDVKTGTVCGILKAVA